MKLISKPIDVIVVFNRDELPMPFRFRYTDEEGDDCVVSIEKVLRVFPQEAPGVETLIYECKSLKHGMPFRYQILYKADTHKWMLYKA